jgi:hypothetical protein
MLPGLLTMPLCRRPGKPGRRGHSIRASIIATVLSGLIEQAATGPQCNNSSPKSSSKEADMLRLSAAHITTASLSVLLLAPTTFAQSGDQAAQPASVSKVRIVRLSQVTGAVSLDRGTGSGFEPAIANLPIVENNRLKTDNGVAEIEFEDNSSVRLAPDSIAEFPVLERRASGATLSSVHLIKGMAYISLMKTPGNEFDLLFGQQDLRLSSSSHIRLQIDGTGAKLAVLDGSVHIDGPAGPVDVPRKKTVTFSMLDAAGPTVAKNIAANPLDAWDHNATDYHARTASMSAFSNSPYAYGMNDMMYYGSFANVGGCGSMWRPYFASAAWDPYANGAWAWYQGAGYSWVSPYPWGWTPYHYGSWSFCQGAGWGWMPGGSWMGLNNMTAVSAPGTGGGVFPPGRLPRPPTHSPRVGESTLMSVNVKPLVQSDVASSTSFVFRKDSAGLGVPRNELGKLDRFSQRALQRGTASTPIYLEARPSAEIGGRAGIPSGAMATSLHRGSPAPAFEGGPSQAGRPGGGNGSFGGRSFGSPAGNSHMSGGSSGAHASAPSSSSGHGH